MVVRSIEQLEKNVSASFGYVKKDILMVNDAISNVHDKIQHLSLNQAMLLEKMSNIEKLLSGKNPSKKKQKVASKKSLSFFDVKTKKKFKTSNYAIRVIKGKKMAVAISPSKTQVFRILGSAKNQKKKKITAKKVVKKSPSKTPKKVITETVLYE